MGERTTITVSHDVKDRLASDKPEGMSWSGYLTTLLTEKESGVSLRRGVIEDIADETAKRTASELENRLQ